MALSLDDDQDDQFECLIPSAHVVNTNAYATLPRSKRAYLADELADVRHELIEQLYKRPCARACEMEVKRKCGIWTKEMLRFYLHDEVPSGLDVHAEFKSYDEFSNNFRDYEIRNAIDDQDKERDETVDRDVRLRTCSDGQTCETECNSNDSQAMTSETSETADCKYAFK